MRKQHVVALLKHFVKAGASFGEDLVGLAASGALERKWERDLTAPVRGERFLMHANFKLTLLRDYEEPEKKTRYIVDLELMLNCVFSGLELPKTKPSTQI